MASYVKSVVIEAPVERVFAFHQRPDALQLLTPLFPPVRVLEKKGGIEPGGWVVLSVAGVRWIARHTFYVENEFFVDEQVEGPFASWVHRHEFEDIGIGTRLTDRVEYLLRGGPLVNTAFAWLVKPGLFQMFAHRHRVTRRFCETDG